MVTLNNRPQTTNKEAQRRNGDAGALDFETMVRDHQRMIHSLCYRLTGSMEDAKDLAQETFVQAYEHFAGFRAEAKVSSWLYRIAVNRCLNWRKRVQRRNQVQQDWARQDREMESGGEDAMWARIIQEALLKLPPKQRAAVVLTIYDGLSHAEAARAMGCSETTVSWRLFVARRKLKVWLKNLRHTEEGDAP